MPSQMMMKQALYLFEQEDDATRYAETIRSK